MTAYSWQDLFKALRQGSNGNHWQAHYSGVNDITTVTFKFNEKDVFMISEDGNLELFDFSQVGQDQEIIDFLNTANKDNWFDTFHSNVTFDDLAG